MILLLKLTTSITGFLIIGMIAVPCVVILLPFILLFDEAKPDMEEIEAFNLPQVRKEINH